MHHYLKAIGVTNNKFMLMLLDPDLASIDPHDPALNAQYKAKVLRECQRNFWYYLREVVRIPEVGKATGVMYKLHRGNLALNFCLLLNLNIFFELPRQQGKSISAAVWYLYVYNFATANAEITFLNKAMKDSKLNLARLKDIRDALPSYLQMSSEYSTFGSKKKKLPSTVETIQHPINNNIIKTAPSARNQTAAANLLRGRTITCLWADEWAFIPYNDIIYTNTIPALETAFINAEKAHSPYGILVTTTPGVMSCAEGKYAYNQKEDATKFSETWYSRTPAEIKSMIDYNKKSTFVYIKFDYKQVGRDEKWFQDICKKIGYDKIRDIRREILLEWSDSPDNCPFTDEQLETIGTMIKPPIQKIELLGPNKNFFLNVYEKIPFTAGRNARPKNPPIMGVDVSGGFSRDYSAITIIDSDTTRVIADFKSNVITQIDLARVILEIINVYYPNAIINIESNGGWGTAVIAKLKESKAKKNLYFEMKERVIEEPTDGLRPVKKKIVTKVYGYNESKNARELVMQILTERAEKHRDKFISQNILDEMKTMEIKRSGKVEHSDGHHDDQVFSYLMALYVWYYGKDLKSHFNMTKHTIVSDMDVNDTVTDLDEEFVSIIEDVEQPTAEGDSKVKDEVDAQLKELAKVPLRYNEYITKVREEEDELLSNMLHNKVLKKAYMEASGYTEEEVDSIYLDDMKAIPDSVFTNFGADVEAQERKRLIENFNFKDFPTDDQ